MCVDLVSAWEKPEHPVLPIVPVCILDSGFVRGPSPDSGVSRWD